jgi:hypothetical protein
VREKACARAAELGGGVPSKHPPPIALNPVRRGSNLDGTACARRGSPSAARASKSLPDPGSELIHQRLVVIEVVRVVLRDGDLQVRRSRQERREGVRELVK